MSSETGNMTVRVAAEKQKQLEAIAARLDRSRNWLVNEAIDHYLNVYEWQTEQIETALDEAKTASPDKFLTGEDMDKRFSRFIPS